MRAKNRLRVSGTKRCLDAQQGISRTLTEARLVGRNVAS